MLRSRWNLSMTKPPGICLAMILRLALLLSAWSIALQAQAPPPGADRLLSVRVRDSVSQAALANVGLFRENSGQPVVTDSSGLARLRVPIAGGAHIVARRVGFTPKELLVGSSSTDDSLTLWLVPVTGAQALPTVAVRSPASAAEARYADFERRRKSGRTGIFITADELRQHDTSLLTDIFRRYPGIRVVDSLGVKFLASSRGLKPVFTPSRVAERPDAKESDLAPCILRVMMDGVSLSDGIDIGVFQVRELQAVEVYVGPASTPVEFAGMIRNSQCGVVMLWTRNR